MENFILMAKFFKIIVGELAIIGTITIVCGLCFAVWIYFNDDPKVEEFQIDDDPDELKTEQS